jgi:hypothetical protein
MRLLQKLDNYYFKGSGLPTPILGLYSNSSKIYFNFLKKALSADFFNF